MKREVSSISIVASSMLAAVMLGLFCIAARGQGWRDELNAEHASNAARIAAIDAEATPLGNQLHQVNAQIQRHNANRCAAPADHPEACAAYNSEARQLNSAQQSLISRLKPLADQADRLIARNREIERKLRCVTLPNPCRSNSDCNECSTCGSFDPKTGKGYCQPRP